MYVCTAVESTYFLDFSPVTEGGCGTDVSPDSFAMVCSRRMVYSLFSNPGDITAVDLTTGDIGFVGTTLGSGSTLIRVSFCIFSSSGGDCTIPSHSTSPPVDSSIDSGWGEAARSLTAANFGGGTLSLLSLESCWDMIDDNSTNEKVSSSELELGTCVSSIIEVEVDKEGDDTMRSCSVSFFGLLNTSGVNFLVRAQFPINGKAREHTLSSFSSQTGAGPGNVLLVCSTELGLASGWRLM